MGMGQDFKPPGIGLQVLVHAIIDQGNPFWGYPIFDIQSHIEGLVQHQLLFGSGVVPKRARGLGGCLSIGYESNDSAP